jgi:hypothetical protein
MKTTQKIGWQKYEDVLESRMHSPLMIQLYKSLANMITQDSELGPTEDVDFDPNEMPTSEPVMLNVDQELSNEIALVSSFDCWVGHTNFNLTEEIKTALNIVDGVEVLKICSRYRFFVGIGKMFDFSEVRKNIEKELTLNEEPKIERSPKIE